MPFLALLLMFNPPPSRCRYITVTIQFPAEMTVAEVQDSLRMVDDLPREGVYVIDVRDLGPHRPKSAKRPEWLPKLPGGAQ